MAKLDTLLVDGHLTSSNELPAAFANRAFLLADGVFESMRALPPDKCRFWRSTSSAFMQPWMPMA